MRKFVSKFIILSACFWPLVTQAGNLYVAPAPKGKASHDGRSAAFPKATLAGAAEIAKPGDNIHLATGHYDEQVTFEHDVTLTPAADVSVRWLGADGSTVRLNNSLTITEQLDLTVGKGGRLVTNAHVLVLGPSAEVTESRYFFVTGNLQAVRPVAGRRELFGQMGFKIDATTSGANLGEVAVLRQSGMSAPVSDPDDTTRVSIDRFWTVRVGQRAVNHVDVSLQWIEADDRQARDLRNVQLWRSTDGRRWEKVTPARPATDRTLTVRLEGFDGGIYTLGDQPRNPNPVEITIFEGELLDQGIRLTWQTAAEQNSAYYEIQRSADGMFYTTLDSVRADPIRDQNQYEYVDVAGADTDVRVFYRLKHHDRNGRVTHYPGKEMRQLGQPNVKRLSPVGLAPAEPSAPTPEAAPQAPAAPKAPTPKRKRKN